MSEPDKTVFVIYVGLRIAGGETTEEFCRLPDDWKPERRPAEVSVSGLEPMRFSNDPRSRKKNLTKGWIVGYVYALPMSGSTGHFGPRVKRIVEWPDTEARAEWCAMDQAARASLEADAFTEHESKRRVDLECLEPLRNAYERLAPRERAALLTRVTRYLMTGR